MKEYLLRQGKNHAFPNSMVGIFFALFYFIIMSEENTPLNSDLKNQVSTSKKSHYGYRFYLTVRKQIEAVWHLPSKQIRWDLLVERLKKGFTLKKLIFYGKLTTLLVCTSFLSDLTALGIAMWIPELKPVTNYSPPSLSQLSLQDYDVIQTRNLFNSQGLIPGDSVNPLQQPSGVATKSTLPFQLIGTLIMKDHKKSLATLEDKSNTQTYPLRTEDEIPGKLIVTKIENRKITFINKTNSKLEYLDINEESQNNIKLTVGAKPTLSSSSMIEQTSPTQFNVPRSEVDRAFADFNNLLTQARAVPNFENGVPAGYKLFQIVPDSLYDKLGLKNGDIITGINGQMINDPVKAFELLSELKTARHLEVQGKKEGKPFNYAYDIR